MKAELLGLELLLEESGKGLVFSCSAVYSDKTKIIEALKLLVGGLHW